MMLAQFVQSGESLMQNQTTRRWMLMLVFCCVLSAAGRLPVGAQSAGENFEGALVYSRALEEGTEYVKLSSGYRYTHTVSLEDFSTVSPGGVYVAKSSPALDELVIIDLSTQEIVIQEPWHPDWRPYSLGWLSDSQLYVLKESSISENYVYDISSGALVPSSYQPLPRSPYPPLPDWVPYIRQNYILPSPTEGVYLYQRCPGAVTVGEGENASCATDYDFVVYDYNLQV
ncbi:MAG: hypothetical protein GYB65_08280, partial [Chloroflexi bacterium]|nr:hypothetical protein [Chloroflexota bacterium]